MAARNGKQAENTSYFTWKTPVHRPGSRRDQVARRYEKRKEQAVAT